ncbi:MAG TPA: choice-of-anchor J domain-containing protein, partial [Bacteroidales bacterium]|nr:choice-of-anchor J domain-containing protein [Bacteroidales bacterium]
MMESNLKVLKLAAIALWVMVSGQITLSNTPPTVFLREGFETGSTQLPSGWINVAIVNNGSWQVGVGAGPFPPGQSGLPDSAAVGATNAYFRVPSSNPYVSRLISPPINLEFAVNPELRFWHAQVPRDGMHARLGVYIATNINGPWTLIANYSSAVNQWTERTLLLPGGSRTLFVAFEGHSGQGLGGSVVVDEVLIVETGTLQREISSIASFQPSTDFVFTGSKNNQVLNTSIKVIGNTGTLSLGSFTVVSQSTLNEDIAPNGVRLWAGQSESFGNATPIGSPQSLVNGQAVFTNLTYSLPTGYTYLWVTFDVASNAQAGNFIDAKLPVGGISINGQSFPAQEQNPAGNRLIIRTIFLDEFESERGWNLSGEWQRAAPLGLGGHQNGQGATSGPSDPTQAISGTRVLGTDLTGLGLYPGNYESNLSELEYIAISPEINTFYFLDVMVSFQRWLNVHLFHRATIDVSTDNGITWSNIWSNYAVQNTSNWEQVSLTVPNANRKQSVRFRFGLGETGGTNLQSGWNIDDFVVTGTFISTDVGVSQWVTPKSTCNLGPNESVTVVVENFGASPTPPVIPLAFSINNGNTWQRDTLRTSIPVGQSVQFTFGPTANFSTPGNYENIVVRTELPTDQYQGNDAFFTEVFSAPVINIPYNESFEAGVNFWRTSGTNSSMELAIPSGTIINSAFSGSMAWVTNSFGAYNAGEVSIIESPCFNFSGILNPVLDLNLNLHTPTGLDGAAVEYSVDGGFTWVRLEPRSHELGWYWYNHSNIAGLAAATGNGRGWTGNSNGWFNPRVVLPVILGNQPSVRFRLIFAAQNVFLNFEGIAMDAFRVYPAPPDVGITEITSPVSDCTLENNEQVTVRISNMGIDTLRTGTNIPVNLIILNTPINISENVILANNLAPGQSLLFSFSQTIDLSRPGTYNLTAYTRLPGDIGFYTPGLSNDSLSAEVIHFGLPEIELGMDFYTTQPDTVVFDAGPGMIHYLWQDGSTFQTFSVTSPNTAWYRVTITDHNNCKSTDSIRVKTYDLAITNALDPLSGCQDPGGERVRIELSNTGHDTFPSGLTIPLELFFEGEKIEDLTWELQQPLLPSEHTVVTFNTIVNVAILGQYSFASNHRFQDANASNDSIQWVVNSLGLPTVNIGDTIFTTQPDTLALDAGAGFASYLWQNGYNGQIFMVSSPYTQTYTVTVTDFQGCSDTDEVVVATYDASLTSLDSPTAGCLPTVPVPVSFTLKNLGVDTLPEGKAFNIAWFLDTVLISSERFLLDTMLLPGDSTAFTFTQLTSIETAGEYLINVEIISRDAEMANNRYGSAIEFLEIPDLQIPSQIVTNRPDTVVLNAGPGHISYLWDNGHTA